MKVLFAVGGFGRGGKERRLISLIEYLAARDVQVGLIAAADSPNLPEIASCCSRIYPYASGEVLFNWRQHRRALMEFRPDVVHSWNGSNTIYAIAAGLGRRYRLVTSEITNSTKQPLLSAEFVRTRVAFAFSDLVLSNSWAGLRAKRAPAAKSQVIYNGYRLERLNAIDPGKYRELRRPEELHVVMCARFNRAKDYGTVIEAATLARQREAGLRFFLAGDGPALAGFQDRARERGLDNVVFLGHVTDIDNLLHQMDVGILMTDPRFHEEGIPNAVMEAMAHRKPVVVTEGGALREIVVDGVNGYFVEPHDPAALVAKLLALKEERGLLETLGANAHRTVREKFDLENMGKCMVEAYRKLLPDDPAPVSAHSAVH